MGNHYIIIISHYSSTWRGLFKTPSGRQAPHVIRHIEVRGQGLGGVTRLGGAAGIHYDAMTHLK